ncbi:hypothetical protein PEX1_085150 [Penicillium expansum]|uniref:Uncharacterized protein n=1 Tax=Penicillium expansum TaxID=27334 RepID=A0A0A2JI80_PENEN|nr:hypothetical protein PEX2_064770 [Penicillium expansum]KGO47697.1 hypothetical protein PEXP_013460 [Penicillium expansum]KGO52015.1 hypothetical protein PEX2_064770 [Penicillium expansum]KGO52937.1 hypothetical protein PEX1_085150 [Penicillium expansum]
MEQSERTARQETETDAIRPSGEMGKWGKGKTRNQIDITQAQGSEAEDRDLRDVLRG